jgi:DivIVA domain-containing protein
LGWYDPAAVDERLERISVIIHAGRRPLASDLPNDFRLRLRGYRREEVDAFIKRIRVENR